MTRGLLIVDVQVDFCEGGKLAVKGGAEVAKKITDYVARNKDLYTTIVASKDWHAPREGVQLSTNGGHIVYPPRKPDFVDSWPEHCIKGSEGCDFHPELQCLGAIDQIFFKGNGKPAYSAFEGTDWEENDLEHYLNTHAITDLDVVGIATDYCVKHSALDSALRNFYTTVLLDLTAAVGGDPAKNEFIETANNVVNLEVVLP